MAIYQAYAKRNNRKGINNVNGKVYGPDRIGLVGFHDRAFVIAKPANPHKHWLQERIMVIDLSQSMERGLMDGKPRVIVVEEALMHLLNYKQRMFS